MCRCDAIMSLATHVGMIMIESTSSAAAVNVCMIAASIAIVTYVHDSGASEDSHATPLNDWLPFRRPMLFTPTGADRCSHVESETPEDCMYGQFVVIDPGTLV